MFVLDLEFVCGFYSRHSTASVCPSLWFVTFSAYLYLSIPLFITPNLYLYLSSIPSLFLVLTPPILRCLLRARFSSITTRTFLQYAFYGRKQSLKNSMRLPVHSRPYVCLTAAFRHGAGRTTETQK